MYFHAENLRRFFGNDFLGDFEYSRKNVATHNLPGLEDVLNAANGIHLKNAF